MTAHAFTLKSYPLATCLDGSPARYYLRQGDSAKIFIFFEGGGFCGSLDDCYQRSSTYYGSTASDMSEMALDRPYFSLDSMANPLLAPFTAVYVRYCDGGYYSGERHTPVQTKGKLLHFNGRWVTEALFADLATRHGLHQATDVVFGGCSAGAIHLFAHLDQLAAKLSSHTRVAAFADSGFYLDRPLFTPLKAFVVAEGGHNASSMLCAQCLRANVNSTEKCLVAEVNAFYLHTPLFAWQSRYDVDQRSCEMDAVCASSPSCVEGYGTDLTDALILALGSTDGASRGGARAPLGTGRGYTPARSLISTTKSVARSRPSRVRHGFFLDGCNRHCDDGASNASMQVASSTPLQALAQWYGRSQRTRWVQPGNFPCASCCSARSTSAHTPGARAY